MNDEIKNRYENIIKEINLHLANFNQHLKEPFELSPIDIENPANFSIIWNCKWADQHWPSKDSPGVYVLCGRSPEPPGQPGIYIGKASSQNIGYRIWNHLIPYRKEGIYKLGNHKFLLEAILAIPVNGPLPRYFASALEEYLIDKKCSGATVVNTVGNR
ncbi:hypothetical protein [Kushneria konosiri]|uniref:hypothetical protein n=1 Tax=Kushneria konosiri TaxID=698828 RepID=UPI0011E4D217|nr:hypothetical protein [Kushneria konosiri]